MQLNHGNFLTLLFLLLKRKSVQSYKYLVLRHAYSKIYHLQPILILTEIPQGKVFMTNKGTEMQKVYYTETGFSIQALFCISCLSHSEAKDRVLIIMLVIWFLPQMKVFNVYIDWIFYQSFQKPVFYSLLMWYQMVIFWKQHMDIESFPEGLNILC